MVNNIIQKIILNKKKWIEIHKNYESIETLKQKIKLSKRNFYHALSNNKKVFIKKCKKASPIKGLICKNYDPKVIANTYKRYASVISIVTEEKYFQGNFDFMHKMSTLVHQPLLCKDFFIDPWQIYFARLYQADAILLILSIIDDFTYKYLSKIAHDLNMGVLTEISNKEELERAIKLNAKVVGINNRNLKDFSVDFSITINLAKYLTNKTIIISESGIDNYSQIRQLSNYVNGFLIGSAIMSEIDIHMAVHKILMGENKICGLTCPLDANIAYDAGAIYGGLIFVPDSLRYINQEIAYNIINKSKLYYVGIFRNAPINYVINMAKILNLMAVQLHGIENAIYINNLRKKLLSTCQIWKSVNMRKSLPKFNLPFIDRYILDSNGGSNKTFNWLRLDHLNLSNTMLAGGLTINNCTKAAKLGCIGLDFNSGVELRPGVKDHDKLYKLFNILFN